MARLELNMDCFESKHFLTNLPATMPTKVTGSESYIKFRPGVATTPEVAKYLFAQSSVSNVSWFDENILLTLGQTNHIDSQIEVFTQLANIYRWQIFDELFQSSTKSLLFQAANESEAGRQLCWNDVQMFLTCVIQQHCEMESKLLRLWWALWKSINLLTKVGETNAPSLIIYKLFYGVDQHVKGIQIDLCWMDRIPCLLGCVDQPFALFSHFIRGLRTEELRAFKITESMRKRLDPSRQDELNAACTLDELHAFLEEIQSDKEKDLFEEMCQIFAAICHLAEVNFEQRGREVLVANSESLSTAAQLLGIVPDVLERELVMEIELIRQHRRSKGFRSAEAANAEKQGLMVELYFGIIRKFFNSVNQYFFPQHKSDEYPAYQEIEVIQAPGYFEDLRRKEQGVSSFCSNVIRDFLEIHLCRRELQAQLKLLREEGLALSQSVQLPFNDNDNAEWAAPELLQLYSSTRINLFQLFQSFIIADKPQLKMIHRKLKTTFKKQTHFFKLKKNHGCFGITHCCQESTLYDTGRLFNLAKVKLTDSFLLFATHNSDSFIRRYLPAKSENILEELQRLEMELSTKKNCSNMMTTRIFSLHSDSVEELEGQIKNTFLPSVRKMPFFPQKIGHHLIVKQFHYLVTPLSRPPEVCDGYDCNVSCHTAYRRLLQKYPIFEPASAASFDGPQIAFLRLYQLRYLFQLLTDLPQHVLNLQSAVRVWLAKRRASKLRDQAQRDGELYVEMLCRSALLSFDMLDVLRVQHTEDMEIRDGCLLKYYAQIGIDEIDNSPQDNMDCSWGRLHLMNFDSVIASFNLQLESYRVCVDKAESSAADDIKIDAFADRLSSDAIALLEFIGDGFKLRKDLNENGEGTGDLLVTRMGPNLVWPWGFLKPQQRCIPTATIEQCIDEQKSNKRGLAVPGIEMAVFSFNEFIAQIGSSITEICAHIDSIQALCVTPIMLVLPNSRVESLSTTPLWLLVVDYHALSKLRSTEFNREVRDEIIKKQYFGEQALDIHRRWVKLHIRKDRNHTENLPLHLNLMHLDPNIREGLGSQVQELIQRAVMDSSSNGRLAMKSSSTNSIKEWARAKKEEHEFVSNSSKRS